MANAFVHSAPNPRPTRFATYAVDTRLACRFDHWGAIPLLVLCGAQSPCKVSLGAAVLWAELSPPSARLPRLTIHRQEATSANDPNIYCEYADGGANEISRVEFGTAVDEIQDPLSLNIGGSLDCGNTGQPYTQRVDEIWVTNGTAEVAYYDVGDVKFGRGK